MLTVLSGHHSPETAYILTKPRNQVRCWVESGPKRGQSRFVHQVISREAIPAPIKSSRCAMEIIMVRDQTGAVGYRPLPGIPKLQDYSKFMSEGILHQLNNPNSLTSRLQAQRVDAIFRNAKYEHGLRNGWREWGYIIEKFKEVLKENTNETKERIVECYDLSKLDDVKIDLLYFQARAELYGEFEDALVKGYNWWTVENNTAESLFKCKNKQEAERHVRVLCSVHPDSEFMIKSDLSK